MESSKFKTIYVFGGCVFGRIECYEKAALELASEMFSRNMNQYPGAGTMSITDLISQAVRDYGPHAIGGTSNTRGLPVGQVEAVVANMLRGRSEMAKHSDAFIALPGGLGTLGEVLEVMAWIQLGIHDKPVGLLNVNGFYDSLLSYIEKAVEDGFISPREHRLIISGTTPTELVEKLEGVLCPHVPLATTSTPAPICGKRREPEPEPESDSDSEYDSDSEFEPEVEPEEAAQEAAPVEAASPVAPVEAAAPVAPVEEAARFLAAGFFCEMCEVWCNSRSQYDDHNIGKNHHKKVMRNLAPAPQ